MSPSRLSSIRHRLLLSLALAPGLTVRELAVLLEWKPTVTFDRLAWLRAAGLVEQITKGPVKTGYRLRPGVVVSENGFVGRVVPLDMTPKPMVPSATAANSKGLDRTDSVTRRESVSDRVPDGRLPSRPASTGSRVGASPRMRAGEFTGQGEVESAAGPAAVTALDMTPKPYGRPVALESGR